MVEEDQEGLEETFGPTHTRWFNGLEEMKMMWSFGVMEPLGMVLGHKEDLALTSMVV